MKRFLLFAFLLLAGRSLQAQVAPPFWREIVAFKKLDSATPPPPRPILLIGSSSFTRWADVQAYFPGYTILNRAFGGSTLPDVLRYAYDVIMPYRPAQVLIYCGENDLASSDSISAEEVLRRVKTLFAVIRTNVPDARIGFVSIKPSPVRSAMQDRVRRANALVKKFLRKQRAADFIDIYGAMLDGAGAMREELYVADRLHMRPEGYAIWQKIIQPYLLRP